MSGITRRSLLVAGATAGAAVAVGARPWTAAAAGPGYLTRSAYTGLEGSRFTVETGGDPVVLKLESVSDVSGAATRRALVGSDDAFALKFSGPVGSPLESGIHTLHHSQLGTIELFASPVDAPESDRNYEILVDRSVGAPAAAPKAPSQPKAAEPEPEPKADPQPEPKQQRELEAAPALLRRLTLRRAGRWLRCELVLRRSVEAERVRCRLVQKGEVVAKATRRVEDGRAVLRLEAAHKLAAGRYTLVVSALDAAGRATSERRRITVR
jgi:hypothetical protein